MRRSLLLCSGLSALVAASPRLVERGSCDPLPAAAAGAPKYSPDTAAAFTAEPAFGRVAAAADVPNGYYQTFSGLHNASVINTMSYLGYSTLQQYDTCGCAQQCDAKSGCIAVNIYFERDPKVNPGKNCPNPGSATQIRCAFYGDVVSAKDLKNYGQWRQQFQVVIAGSNGYVNTARAVAKAKNAISSNSLQPYCSSVLGYTIPTITSTALITTTPQATITSTTSIIISASTDVTSTTEDIVSQPTTFFVTTRTTVTLYSTTTITANQKRDATKISIKTADYPDHILPPLPSVDQPARRSAPPATTTAASVLATPAALTKYPSGIISTACSQVVSKPTSTSTIIASATVTAAPVTSVVQATYLTTVVNTNIVQVAVTSTIYLATTLTITATDSTVLVSTATATPAPLTCANEPDVSFPAANSACGCSYDATCGKYPLNFDYCGYDVGSGYDFQTCASQCDFFGNCYGFVLEDVNGACTLCPEVPGRSGDGSVGFTTGFRKTNSCTGSQGCLTYQGN